MTGSACAKVTGFSGLHALLQQKVSISGKSQGALKSHGAHLAKPALHFGCLPTALDPGQINGCPYLIQQRHNTPSGPYFKFTVYGLRFAFRMMGLKDRHIELPSIKHEKKLPAILSREEMKRLLKAPKLLKHRILLALLYGCGLRCFEVRNVMPGDPGFGRAMPHVRKGKGKNPCRNRHCPKCQGNKRGQWIAGREAGLLPLPCFHVVFALPDLLGPLAIHRPKELYGALFEAAWQTMRTFGQGPKHLGAQTGMTAILHAWGQTPSLHPHLHCTVPGGGPTKQGKWKTARGRGKFPFPAKAMGGHSGRSLRPS